MASTATSLFRVDGLISVVTGGGTGIGRMIAQSLAENGAKKVYILGRRLEALQDAASPYPAVIVPVQCDITSKSSLQAAVDGVASEVGYVNLVVANSGIYGPAAAYDFDSVAAMRRAMFDEVAMDDFTRVFHVNVTGVFFTVYAFLELLDEGNRRAVAQGTYGRPQTEGGKVPYVQSQVIVTASIGGYLRTTGAAPAYAGSKAAVIQMAKQAASRLAPFGIRTNIIAPGFFPSEMADSMIAHRKPEDEPFTDPDFIPAKKFGSEKEMGGTVLYLASQAGSFCNGLVLACDGGRMSVTQASY